MTWETKDTEGLRSRPLHGRTHLKPPLTHGGLLPWVQALHATELKEWSRNERPNHPCPPALSLFELLESDVEVERLVAVVECQSDERMPPLGVRNFDDKIPTAVRDALHRSVLDFAHGEQLAVSPERAPNGSRIE